MMKITGQFPMFFESQIMNILRPWFVFEAPVNGTEIAPPVEVASPADERAREASAEIAPREAPAPEPTPQPVIQREATEVVITQADPNRPKKGGWWQRVRTPFGG